jgi:hypothetical protein
MNNNDKTNDNNDLAVFSKSDKSMNIADRLINPTIVISTLCRRMLSNQEMDNVIRYNLEVILEEIEKIQESVSELRAS